MKLFSLKNKYALDKPIHKIDFINYSPSSLATINNIFKHFHHLPKRRCIYLFTKLISIIRI